MDLSEFDSDDGCFSGGRGHNILVFGFVWTAFYLVIWETTVNFEVQEKWLVSA